MMRSVHGRGGTFAGGGVFAPKGLNSCALSGQKQHDDATDTIPKPTKGQTMQPQPPLNRRSFLKTTAAASAAAAAGPMFLPRSARGANERFMLGLIGAGPRGRSVAGAFARQADVTVAMRADVHKARGDTQNYHELLERDDIDGVIVATGDRWHALAAIHAAQAGKHIFTEKPLSFTVREGRKMVEATRRYNVVHQTGSQQRSMDDDYRACMLIRNGAIGKVRRVQAYNYCSPMEHAMPGGDAPPELDWDRWCGPVAAVPYNENVYPMRANPGWMSFRQFSGGEMTGWGTHGLDHIQWALGKDDSGPVELWTEGEPFEPWIVKEPRPGRFHGPKEPKIFMRYDDGADGIEVEFTDDAPMGGGVFYGEKGTIRSGRGSLRSDPPELAKVGADELEAMDVQLYRSRDHNRDWLDCIKSGERPCADVEVGHRSATVCHLANIARWTGRRLRWDPVKEQFLNDDDANTYLDYERRKGYELPDPV